MERDDDDHNYSDANLLVNFEHHLRHSSRNRHKLQKRLNTLEEIVFRLRDEGDKWRKEAEVWRREAGKWRGVVEKRLGVLEVEKGKGSDGELGKELEDDDVVDEVLLMNASTQPPGTGEIVKVVKGRNNVSVENTEMRNNVGNRGDEREEVKCFRDFHVDTEANDMHGSEVGVRCQPVGNRKRTKASSKDGKPGSGSSSSVCKNKEDKKGRGRLKNRRTYSREQRALSAGRNRGNSCNGAGVSEMIGKRRLTNVYFEPGKLNADYLPRRKKRKPLRYSELYTQHENDGEKLDLLTSVDRNRSVGDKDSLKRQGQETDIGKDSSKSGKPPNHTSIGKGIVAVTDGDYQEQPDGSMKRGQSFGPNTPVKARNDLINENIVQRDGSEKTLDKDADVKTPCGSKFKTQSPGSLLAFEQGKEAPRKPICSDDSNSPSTVSVWTTQQNHWDTPPSQVEKQAKRRELLRRKIQGRDRAVEEQSTKDTVTRTTPTRITDVGFDGKAKNDEVGFSQEPHVACSSGHLISLSQNPEEETRELSQVEQKRLRDCSDCRVFLWDMANKDEDEYQKLLTMYCRHGYINSKTMGAEWFAMTFPETETEPPPPSSQLESYDV